MTDRDRPRGLRLPPGPEDTRLGGGESFVIVGHSGDVHRFGQPSTYSLTHAELTAHVRELRRSGWQSWEVATRFDFAGAA